MSNIRIELNSEGVRSLLKSSEMMDYCTELAEGIKGRYGKSAKIEPYTGTNRINVAVVSSYSDASKDNSLLKAVR